MFTVYSDMFRLTRVIFKARTIFVYKVTVPILGSQTLTCFFALMLSAVNIIVVYLLLY